MLAFPGLASFAATSPPAFTLAVTAEQRCLVMAVADAARRLGAGGRGAADAARDRPAERPEVVRTEGRFGR